MVEVIVGVLSTAAITMAGWAVAQVIKVPSLQEEVAYIRGRVDAIYDHLIQHKETD